MPMSFRFGGTLLAGIGVFAGSLNGPCCASPVPKATGNRQQAKIKERTSRFIMIVFREIRFGLSLSHSLHCCTTSLILLTDCYALPQRKLVFPALPAFPRLLFWLPLRETFSSLLQSVCLPFPVPDLYNSQEFFADRLY